MEVEEKQKLRTNDVWLTTLKIVMQMMCCGVELTIMNEKVWNNYFSFVSFEYHFSVIQLTQRLHLPCHL